MPRSTVLVFSLLSVAGAFPQWDGQPTPLELDTVLWATGLNQGLEITNCGDGRLFVLQRLGVVRIIADSGVVLAPLFLDIQGPVNDAGGEQGLLGLAFDPDYANNGFFYVNYTGFPAPGVTRVVRYSVSADPNVALPASAHLVFQHPQPDTNHNGGDLEFGPDGMLYIPLGDGGGTGDPDSHAQDLTEPLGDILRIDVSDPDTTYTVPADNPYFGANNDTLPEIWASGLRNPFRFAFDDSTGDMWIGDVGQSAWEEIDFWPAGDNSGPNFGWRCYEGNDPYDITGCQAQSFYDPPIITQSNGPWCAIIGGRVYRGARFPRLFGRYVYVDYCLGEFHALSPDGIGGWTDETVLATGIQGFTCIGADSAGTLYTLDKNHGRLFQLRDRCAMPLPVVVQNGSVLESSPGIEWQWYLNDTLIDGATSQDYAPMISGDYHVVVYFDSACALASSPVTFIAASIGDHSQHDARVLSSVSGGSLHVSWPSSLAVTSVEITDVSGRLVSTRSVAGADHLAVDVLHWPATVFVVVLRAADGRVIDRLRVAATDR